MLLWICCFFHKLQSRFTTFCRVVNEFPLTQNLSLCLNDQRCYFQASNWRCKLKSLSYEAKHSKFTSRWRNPLSSFSSHKAVVTQCCLVTLSINNFTKKCRTNDSAKNEFICVAARTTEKYTGLLKPRWWKFFEQGHSEKLGRSHLLSAVGLWKVSVVFENDLLLYWRFITPFDRTLKKILWPVSRAIN